MNSMDRRCEFCMTLSSVVYCKSDAAHLCLSCDAKVHSANALSYKHARTLVCESCRYQPAHIQCFDHRLVLCQTCDTSHHISLQQAHHKRVISCYTGCPSAKELASLWAFNSNTDQTKNNNILQQISDLDLEMIQLSHDHQFGGNLGSPLEESLSSLPFSQLDNFTRDSFWQCKSPAHNNEIWLQNMQDLGVCDEVQSFDDDGVRIPDVDLTFPNFEELFGSEQETAKRPSVEQTQSNDVYKERMNDQLDNQVRTSYSTSSFSVSRITGESSGSEYKEDELSSTFPHKQLQSDSFNDSENVIMRSKKKKDAR